MTRSRLNEDTRQRLLEEGVMAFLRQGYHGTGLKQVLDKAGVPKGSFYNYFDSKEAFGAAAIDHYAECLSGKLARAKADHGDPLTGLRAFFKQMMEEYAEDDYVGGCLVANLGGEFEDSPFFRAALQAALDKYRAGICQALAEAQEAGQIRDDIPAPSLAQILIDAWEGAVIRMKIIRSLEPLEHCLEQMLNGFFRPSIEGRSPSSH